MSLGVIKEFCCALHGEFECSHPICPEPGCDSSAVVREFRTAPTIGSRMVKQHHAGLKRSSDMMGIANFRTAREGEAAHGGRSGVLWGDECKKVLGRSFAELTSIAQKPLVVNRQDGSQLRLDRNNGMADAARAAGITQRRIAKPGELAVPRDDQRSIDASQAVVK